MSTVIGLVVPLEGARRCFSMPDEKMFKKLGVWIDRPTEEAIQEWVAAYTPKYDYSNVVRLLIDAGLRTVRENPERIFGLRPARREDLGPRRDEATGPSSISPATGTRAPGAMTTGTYIASGGPTSTPPAPEPQEPATKPRKPRDPAKPKKRRDDPTREPTQDELDDYTRRARR